jgi:dienelactone hydrolase
VIRELIARALVGATILAAALPAGGAGPEATLIDVPWRAGNAQTFRAGSPEEGGRYSAVGSLPVSIHRPAAEGRAPFVVLLHGCGGLSHDAMWTRWAEPWVDFLGHHGVGAAIVDSFAPRGVSQVCTRNPGPWAVRRADDAYSARAWLAEQPYVDGEHIAVMGMSNGGRTVLAALRTTLKHSAPFVAGVALYPGCQSDVEETFYAPLLVLVGRADTVTPARYCEEMKRRQPPAAPELTLVVYPRAPHTFDMPLPDRRVLGMRLGFDPDALADARRHVATFLTNHGVVRATQSQ